MERTDDASPLSRGILAATDHNSPWHYDPASAATPIEQREHAVRLVLLAGAPDYFRDGPPVRPADGESV